MSGELWVVAGALALVAVVAVLMRRRLVRLTLEVFGLRVEAEGDRPPAGVKVSRSRAGRHIIAEGTGGGGTTVERSSADGDIRASHHLDGRADRRPEDGGPRA